MAILATFRLVDLFVADSIFNSIRNKFPQVPWKCVRCNSVWSGALATLFYYFVPWLNWPLALSWFYLAYGDFMLAKLKDG